MELPIIRQNHCQTSCCLYYAHITVYVIFANIFISFIFHLSFILHSLLLFRSQTATLFSRDTAIAFHAISHEILHNASHNPKRWRNAEQMSMFRSRDYSQLATVEAALEVNI